MQLVSLGLRQLAMQQIGCKRSTSASVQTTSMCIGDNCTFKMLSDETATILSASVKWFTEETLLLLHQCLQWHPSLHLVTETVY